MRRATLLLLAFSACSSSRPVDAPPRDVVAAPAVAKHVVPAQPPPATTFVAPSASTPPAPVPRPAPKLTADEASSCAHALAAKLGRSPKLTAADSTAVAEHWFSLEQPALAVVVSDADCSAAFAPEVDDPHRFDAATAARFVKLKKAAWDVVSADGEYRALCKRLEDAKKQHTNLRGCVAWVDEFPPDLCTTAYVAREAAGNDPMLIHQRIQHPCHWRFYVGERMDTHTNRHFTLSVDPTRRQVVGAVDPGGHPTPGDVWRRGPTLRQALQARLARERVVKKRCTGLSACPVVATFGSECDEPRCFSVQLARADGEPEIVDIETEPSGAPKRVYDNGHELTFEDWLDQLAKR